MTLVKFKRNQHPFASNIFNVFDDFFNHTGFHPDPFKNRVPAVNISEEDHQYMIEVAAPGLTKSDFNVALDQDVLTISAAKKEESSDDGEAYTRKEFNYTSFSRSFNVPDTIDREKIAAKYSDGILHLTLPKKEVAKKEGPATIKIS